MELNYLKLYFSLTFAGLTIWGVDEAVDLYKLKLVTDAANSAIKQSQFEAKSAAIKAQTEALKQKNRNQIISRQNAQREATIRNAQRTNNEICSFWRGQYNSSNTDRNKLMMEGACERASKPPSMSTTTINLKGNN
ncbi:MULTISPECIES: hypothetical protein [unclassified Pseudoalteromonas]|uniref:hypothetical protein n=1 Tax=unclassified Pseudoalteromonas TaxID=194690 RepID=UPI0023592617|nr:MULTISPECIES: hypothetical protein [unclassified Pseudoalteromonas]MDC9564004.1 hypothetical protein [Pseudoalteromonas sp. GAB2316C]MDC9567954.1 hypothetical protein [Pseudoalteromonas sp. GABNB9D]MDC9572216.1 hypothetical protein [Pseudoalteromonas sp. GABNS16A]MDC9577351.1 hypothetical protein [Pseudoalteromonas sp. GABNS16E]MDC9586837.1 hypothetical protein [Pseudoalteromonas sp. GABNS16C]